MSLEVLIMILVLVLTAIYLPVAITVLRKHEGQETAAIMLSAYAAVAVFLGIGEALQRGGQWQIQEQLFNDIQLYGAILLAAILLVTTLEFTRRDIWTWVGIGIFWGLVIIVIVSNILGLNDVIWTNGTAALTRDRLAPALSALGWFVFTVAALVTVRSAYVRSRQPLLRNRLNYWTPVFFLAFINDILLIAGREIPGNPFRVAAAIMAMYVSASAEAVVFS